MSARHHAPNDLIARGFASAGFPVSKEPTGVQIRREAPGRSHARPLAEWHGPLLGGHSYLFAIAESLTSMEPTVRQLHRQSLPLPARKRNTRTLKVAGYIFEPIAIVETLGVLSTSARQLMSLLG